MPSKGRGGEAERQKERLASWRGLSKDVLCMRALREGASHLEPAIARGCEAFGLTASDPKDRELLLAILADVLFRPAPTNALAAVRTRGAQQEWTQRKVTQLRRDIVAAYPGDGWINEQVHKIAFRLQKKYPEKYSAYEIETLKRLIRRKAFRVEVKKEGFNRSGIPSLLRKL
jgi:hypothetical protein